MKRLNLGFWLLAWSCWLWLGFGLHRELPRDLGPPVCRLPTVKNQKWAMGFIGDTNEVVIFGVSVPIANGLPDVDDSSTVIQIFDAESGKLLRETEGPPRNIVGRAVEYVRRGVLFSRSPPDSPNASGLHALDLNSMKWRRLSHRTVRFVCVHERKPWIAYCEFPDSTSPTADRAIVQDFETGEASVICQSVAAFPISGKPFFLNDDRLVVSRYVASVADQNRHGRMEIWRVGGSARLLRTLDGLPTWAVFSRTASGRLLFRDPSNGLAADVYDLQSEYWVYSNPPRDRRERKNPHWPFEAVLSTSGRCILSGDPPFLLNIDDDVILWRPAWHEEAKSIPSQQQFVVEEKWHKFWSAVFPSRELQTTAFRSLEHGRLIVRLAGGDPIRIDRTNSAGTLLIVQSNDHTDGEVHRFPFPVNYPLLALCQTILALPLVMLWAVLRWRRRRRARLASA